MPLRRLPPGHYETLAELLGEDEASVRRVIRSFCVNTLADLADMDHAAALGDWKEVRRLATRIRNGCHCVHVGGVVDVLDCLLVSTSDHDTRAVYLRDYSKRRSLLVSLIASTLDGIEQVRDEDAECKSRDPLVQDPHT
jgi:hypothetical protein